MINEIFATIMILTVFVGYDVAHKPPVPTVEAKEVVEVVMPTPTPIPDTPQEYIKYKFGEDYQRAYEIVECESKWDERAFNDNSTWGGVGQDRGLWQINNVYHPVTVECAYDYKCSTDYAYRMYINDNKTFVRWTCGRYFDN